MNPSLAAVALVTALAASAMLGPLLLRRSAPALMRVPRIAVAVVSGGAVAWSAALLALGPMVAWAATGPSLLAGGAGDVCQRCLASASPFAAQGGSLAVPAIVPLTIGALTALVVAGGVAVELRRRRGASRATALWLQENATRTV